MASRRCMNGGCSAPALGGGEWRKGWALSSGGFATLCDKCGIAYEESVYCDTFHQKESGWRECVLCGKRLHCGCIASKFLLDLLDNGGVQCIGCMKNSNHTFISNLATQEIFPQSPQRVTTIASRSPKDEQLNDDFNVALSIGARDDSINKGKVVETGKRFEVLETGSSSATTQDQFRVSQRDDITSSSICESLTKACLSIGLGNLNQNSPKETQLVLLPMPNDEGREQNKSLSTFQQSQRARHLLPKPFRTGLSAPSEASKEVVSQMRVARPPAEGRGRNQLLPRYWPRITDQELQQISGDSNSTIVPLFEKVLSASDAGRIGRLVLPKACAEAYFPPISQPEGLPLKIQDAKGKEWHFQFRFWPNNNSRMYVLEGVTPCIQSLQLQAGDTVTFSRMDPEGKLIMGYRKATNSMPLQDSQISSIASAALGNDTFLSSLTGNLPVVSGYSGLLQSMKGFGDPLLSCSSEHFNTSDGNFSWQRTNKYGAKPNEGLLMHPSLIPESKRSRNIGAKSKRLHIDNDDAMELKFSWEEAQDLLAAPPAAKASIVEIEDYEIEEYEEAPVFGKQTIFTARISGEQDQWVQCDDCFKWRRLPVDVIVSSKWTCLENIWDRERSFCSVPDELSPRELQSVLQQNTEIKRRRTEISNQNPLEQELSVIDTSTADTTNPSSPLTTTKHPRHRPGCTCIVCIQPPSGKGPKHNPNCTCNVCNTVKRRFKTLMMRKKKRMSEREETNKESSSADKLDLNSQPSMMSLLRVANLPLENYLKQNGLTSLVVEQRASSSSATVVPQAVGVDESEREEEGSCSKEKTGIDA